MFIKKICVFFLSFLFITNIFASEPQHLPVEKVFKLSASWSVDQSLKLHWQIAPGYYLYKERFLIELQPEENASDADPQMGHIFYPKAKLKHDKLLGDYYVYGKDLTLAVPFIGVEKKTIKLKVGYQGCADYGLCYPKQFKVITANFANNSVEITNPNVPKQLDKIVKLLSSGNTILILLVFLGYGLLLAFTPCLYPMFPILMSIIIGQVERTAWRAFKFATAYVFGMATTYALVAVVLISLQVNIQSSLQIPWLIAIFSLLFFLFGLSLLDLFTIQLPGTFQNKVQMLQQKLVGGNVLNVFIMGLLAALVVSPCALPPLAAALAYMSSLGNVALGAQAMFTMGIGMGLPLIFFAVLEGRYLPKSGPWLILIKNIFALMMFAVAIWMLDRLLPGEVILILWALLAALTSYLLGLFRKPISKITKVCWLLGLFVFIYAGCLVVGAMQGNSNPLKPILFSKQHSLAFKKVENLEQLNNILQNTNGKPVMLDFYADWCVACQHMEETTFKNKQILALGKNFTLIQVDVTKNSLADQAIQKHFGVIAPPTILFFDKNGQQIKSATLVAEVDSKTLTHKMLSVMHQ